MARQPNTPRPTPQPSRRLEPAPTGDSSSGQTFTPEPAPRHEFTPEPERAPRPDIRPEPTVKVDPKDLAPAPRTHDRHGKPLPPGEMAPVDTTLV